MSITGKSSKIKPFAALSREYSDTSILMHEAIARKAGLSGTDHKYLGILLQKGEMTAGELARLTGLTTGAITGLVDRLEKKKLVKRRFTKDDRRKVLLVPHTDNAMTLLSPLFAGLQEKTTRLVHSFSDKEIQTIESYFTQAIAIMKETLTELQSA